MTTALPALAPGVWAVDPVHSEASVTVRHLGVSKVRGSFGEFSGALTVGEGGALSLTAEIVVGSIDTKNSARDGHLQSADFFDTAQFPTASYRSTSVRPDGDGYLVEGELTLRGVTKPVPLRLELGGVAQNPQSGDTVAGFAATGSADRREFGITSAPGLLSDNVVIALDVEAVLQA